LMTTEFAFSALNTPMSPAWPHRNLHVEGLALPKSFKSDHLSFGTAVIRRMSDKTDRRSFGLSYTSLEKA